MLIDEFNIALPEDEVSSDARFFNVYSFSCIHYVSVQYEVRKSPANEYVFLTCVHFDAFNVST